MDYYAHSTPDPTRENWQRLHEHLCRVSELAFDAGSKFGAGKATGLSGALHDLGKYTVQFLRRLNGSGEPVDHATAGAQAVIRLATSRMDDRHMAMLIAYAIAGHHGGMPDGEGGTASLADRLRKPMTQPDPVWREQVPVNACGLMPVGFSGHPDIARRGFQFGFLGRMLFSCLVDADYRDTEAFYAGVEGREVVREQVVLPGIIDELCAAFDAAMAPMRGIRNSTAVNRLRNVTLDHVLAQANKPTGLFTLTVPTGGGKTLASLGFALEHAKANKLDRIIYAIPYTSVIDQTAAIFKAVRGDANVLEHHSAIDDEVFRWREGADKLKLAMEDWAVPVVVTTNVQLFESLFSNRPSRCRKLHNLARSVIVLDEAQTIPLSVLRPCVAALDELARNYGTSIVLCTATQPALAAPAFVGGFDTLHELALEPARLFAELARVTIRRAGTLTDDQLVAGLAMTDQGLVIVNSRAHALRLYQQVVASALPGAVHLTTRQYAQHRRVIMADVRARLAAGHPCRLIATSLVEAGVDLDFPLVWRAEAGIDQIAQAAGRCNREGRWDPADSIVTVFRPAEGGPPRSIARLVEAGGRIMGRHEHDLLSPDAIRDYFREVYWGQGQQLDEFRVLEKFQIDMTGMNLSYQTVADNFALIDSPLEPIVIARDPAAIRTIGMLASPDTRAGAVARLLQPYIVQVPPAARTRLQAAGDAAAVEPGRFGDQFVVLRNSALYDDDTGLWWEAGGGG
jgi:CRISPR-associated endonuclease/helicase Cas3